MEHYWNGLLLNFFFSFFASIVLTINIQSFSRKLRNLLCKYTNIGTRLIFQKVKKRLKNKLKFLLHNVFTGRVVYKWKICEIKKSVSKTEIKFFFKRVLLSQEFFLNTLILYTHTDLLLHYFFSFLEHRNICLI